MTIKSMFVTNNGQKKNKKCQHVTTLPCLVYSELLQKTPHLLLIFNEHILNYVYVA